MAKEGQAATLNETEKEQFLSFLAQNRHFERNRAIFALGYFSGLRVGSIAGLTLDDVVENGVVKERVVLRSAITKGGKVITAYLNHPELREALEAWLKVRHSRHSDALFVSQKGGAFTPKTMCSLVCGLFDKAGMTDKSSHSMRRSAASNWLHKGANIFEIKTLLGHSSITTTQRYLEADDNTLASIVGG